MTSLRIVYFGTPQFSATVLDYLLKQQAAVVAVVTKPDKPKGRSNIPQPSPVKQLAQSHFLPFYQPQKASSPEFAAVLKTINADLFVVVAYSEILKENLLQMPRLGCINVHASLLPKYRGAAPIQRSIMEGEKESGVTIMSMAKELDAGDILEVVKTPISDEMTAGELFETLSHLGARALWNVLQQLEKGNVARQPQNIAQVTYAKKLTLEDGKIDWKMPCEVIHNQIRGVTPKPGAWCCVLIKGEQRRLLVKKARIESAFSGIPGSFLHECKGLTIACGQGALSLLEVQLEGKKSLSADEFLRGIDKNEIMFIT